MPTALRCPKCGRGYRRRERLKRHLLKHVADTATAYALASRAVRLPSSASWACAGCSRHFGTRQGLSVHLRLTQHLGFNLPVRGPAAPARLASRSETEPAPPAGPSRHDPRDRSAASSTD